MHSAVKLNKSSKLRSYKNTNFSNKCIIFQNCNKLPYLNLTFDSTVVFMDNCHEQFVNTWLTPLTFPNVHKLYLSSPCNMNTLDMFFWESVEDNMQIYLSNKYTVPYPVRKDHIFIVKHEQIKNLISKYSHESLVVTNIQDL